MNFLDTPIFSFIITLIVSYGPGILSENGRPLLGIILSTFPTGIFSLLTLKNTPSLDILITHIITSSVIISLTWVGIYLNSGNNDFKFLSMLGLCIWGVLSILYYIYLSYTGN